MKNQKLESYRTKLWAMEQRQVDLQKDIELMKYQLAVLESIEGENSNSGVEAATQIDPSRLLSRKGSNKKKLALAQAMQKNKPLGGTSGKLK